MFLMSYPKCWLCQPSVSLYLLEELERALLGNIAQLAQTHDSLLASRMLLLADDTALLRLHQVLLRQATGRVLGRAVVNLRRAANSHHLSTLLLAVLASKIARHSIFRRKILLSPYTNRPLFLTDIHSFIIAFQCSPTEFICSKWRRVAFSIFLLS